MAYVDPDYPTKEASIQAVKAGKVHATYNSTGMCPTVYIGSDFVEGPHYPKPHKWYSSVVVHEGMVVSAK